MERMWPLPVGLLLERTRLPPSHDVASLSQNVDTSSHEDNQGSNEEAPTLYSLMHPLEEMLAVSFLDFASSLALDFVPSPTVVSSTTSGPFNTPAPNKKKAEGDFQQLPFSTPLHDSSSPNSIPLPQRFSIPNPKRQFTLGSMDGEDSDDEEEEDSPFFAAPHIRLIYSSNDIPLVVTYNTETKLHSIWLIRKVAPTPITSAPLSKSSNAQSQTQSDPLGDPFASLQASFQAGYTQDLRWSPQTEGETTSQKISRSDLRFEHLFTEIPKYVPKDTQRSTETKSTPSSKPNKKSVSEKTTFENSSSSSLNIVRNVDGDGYEGSSAATHAFLLVTPEANLRLCLMLGEQKVLHLYELTSPEDEDLAASSLSPSLSPSSHALSDNRASTLMVVRKRVLPCLSAIPLGVMDPLVLNIANKSIRLSTTFLLLSLDHSVSLYSMESKICDCTIPKGLADSEEGQVDSLLSSHLVSSSSSFLPVPPSPSTSLILNDTPLFHRTPSLRSIKRPGARTLSSSKLITPSTLHKDSSSTPQPNQLGDSKSTASIMRTPIQLPARTLSHSHFVLSPMTPGSPFLLNTSSDLDLSAMDLDMSIDQILATASPATPARPQASSSSTLPAHHGIETPSHLAPRSLHASLFATPTRARPSAPIEPSTHAAPHSQASQASSTQPINTSPPAKYSKPQIIELLQPVSNRFCILYDDGRMFRVSLKIAPSSPLISDCLRAASSILHHSAFHLLLSEHLEWKHTMKATGLGEWETFVCFVLALLPSTRDLLSYELSTSLPLPSSEGSDLGASDEDWEFLIGSDFHANRMRESAYRSLPLSSSKNDQVKANISNTDSKNLGEGQKDTNSSKKNDSSHGANKKSARTISIIEKLKKHCKSSSEVEETVKKMSEWSEREATKDLRSILSHLLHALHLLCENYKLSVLTMPWVSQLTELLEEVAVLRGWQSYANFYASATSGPLLSLPSGMKGDAIKNEVSPLLLPAPSIMQWLHDCLNYSRKTFPILREANQPCELTRKICRIYNILVHGPPEEPDEIETYFEPFSSLPVTLGQRLHKTPRTSPIKSAQLQRQQHTRWLVRARLAVIAMEEEFSDLSEIEALPPGIALPLREALHAVRHFPPTHWPLSCYRFIGREDLAMQGLSFQKVAKAKYSLPDAACEGVSSSSSTSPLTQQPPSHTDAAGGNANSISASTGLARVLHAPFGTSTGGSSSLSAHGAQSMPGGGGVAAGDASGDSAASSFDGTELSAPASLMRFSHDERLAEVSRLLRSSHVVPLIETEEISHQSDANQISSYSFQLLCYVNRLLSLPVGRGMYTLAADLEHWGNADYSGEENDLTKRGKNTTGILKSCARTESIEVPALMMKGRRPDNKTMVALDPAPGVAEWAEFHNGVAAGLRLPPAHVETISWQWIVSNRPKQGQTLTASHAGFLLSMGLLGHLKAVDATGLYDYLSLFHPLTSSALLVGYASCMYGTRSAQLTKVLDIHLPKRPSDASGAHSSSGLGLFGVSSSAGADGGAAAFFAATATQASAAQATWASSSTSAPSTGPSSSTFASAFYSAAPSTSFDSIEDINMPEMVQCAAIVAAGLGFAETNHRHLVESFLSHLAQPRFAPLALESFTLSCGVALGFICLGQGHLAPGLADLDLLNRLCACLEGTAKYTRASESLSVSSSSSFAKSTSQTSSITAASRSTKSSSIATSAEATLQASQDAELVRGGAGLLSIVSHNANFAPSASSGAVGTIGAGLAGGSSWGAPRSGRTPAMPLRMGAFDVGLPGRRNTSGSGSNSGAGTNAAEKSDAPIQMKAPVGIQKEISAPGACLALTMIYMKTNDEHVASRVALPNGMSASQPLSLLAFIRPDVQIQRVLARNLIMWNDMNANQSYDHLEDWMKRQYPKGSKEAIAELMAPLHLRTAASQSREGTSADVFQLQKVAWMTTSAGAAMALGIKYAGTSNANCCALFSSLLVQMLKLQRVIPEKSDKRCAEMSALQIVLAHSLVLAGTGSLSLLRTLRKLRKRLSIDGKSADGIYGYHMAIGMAIGFLFLGGGRFSISSSPKAIASLLTSLYPLWPLSPPDDRYHLQLLRHLYVLAVEPRCLEARDVDLLSPQFVPVRFWVRSHSSSPSNSSGTNDHPIYNASSSDTGPQELLLSKPNQKKGKHPYGHELSTSNQLEMDRNRSVYIVNAITPCLMPPAELLVKVEISSPFHWRAAFRPHRNRLHQHMFQAQKFILVKKRHGQESTTIAAIEGENRKKGGEAESAFNPSLLLSGASSSSSLVPPSLFKLESPSEDDDEAGTAETISSASDFSAHSPFALAKRMLSTHPTLLEYAKVLLSNPDEEEVETLGVDVSARSSNSALSLSSMADLHSDQEMLSLLQSCLIEDKEKMLTTLLWLHRYSTSSTSGLKCYTSLDRINVDLILQFYDSGIANDFNEADSAAPIDALSSSAAFNFALSAFSSATPSVPAPATPNRPSAASSPHASPLVPPSLLQSIRSTRLHQVHSN